MPGGKDRPDITPDLKIGALLDAYPDLEDVLIRIAPAFKKLRNPVLRRTVAKLTTLRQAAQVGGVSLGETIRTLRGAAGIAQQWNDEAPGVSEALGESGAPGGLPRPEWLDGGTLVETFDAREMIEGGGHPLPVVMGAVRKLEPGQIYAIITPFTPAPMIDKVREKGYEAWTAQEGAERFITYFRCKQA
ncbi:MAG: DUF1858 domain-containing protein [Chitinivibrionia bacterium]|nr:DUF1858 domain-containing protein [Chitinivibrionia bacterium]